MNVWLATTNAGKVREFETLGVRYGWSFAQYEGYREPVEDGETFAANAAIKAQTLSAALRSAGMPGFVLADDSGLAVRALGGRPGIYSARYGGTTATWAQRRAALIAEVDASGAADRGASFVCAIEAIDVAGRSFNAQATCAGTIVRAERGDAGFSFDAIFEEAASGLTFAELGEPAKNQISHRALAFRALLGSFLLRTVRRSPSPS